MRPRERTFSFLFSRKTGVCAFACLVLIILGCMSFTVNRGQVVQEDPPDPIDGSHSRPPGDGVLEQEGTFTLASEAVQDVYYPVPYISPPNLTVTSPLGRFVLLSQKAGHFRIGSNSCFAEDVHWKAKGVKILLAAPALDATPALPAEPVQVSPKP